MISDYCLGLDYRHTFLVKSQFAKVTHSRRFTDVNVSDEQIRNRLRLCASCSLFFIHERQAGSAGRGSRQSKGACRGKARVIRVGRVRSGGKPGPLV